MTPEEKMQELGLELKPVAIGNAALIPWVQVGNLLYMSGRTPDRTGKKWNGAIASTEAPPAAKASPRRRHPVSARMRARNSGTARVQPAPAVLA